MDTCTSNNQAQNKKLHLFETSATCHKCEVCTVLDTLAVVKSINTQGIGFPHVVHCNYTTGQTRAGSSFTVDGVPFFLLFYNRAELKIV